MKAVYHGAGKKSTRFLFETRSILNILTIWRVCTRLMLSRVQIIFSYHHYVLAIDMLYSKYNVCVVQHLPVIPRLHILRHVKWNAAEKIVTLCRLMIVD